MSLLLILAIPSVADAQSTFEPRQLYHVTVAQILGRGEMLELPMQGDSGLVPLAARLYWLEYPGSCQEPTDPCRTPYYLVVFDPSSLEGPLVWTLGMGGRLIGAEWLPPTAEMNPKDGRLRLSLAAGRDAASGALPEVVEFEIGWDRAVVLAER